jgi:glutamate racemase
MTQSGLISVLATPGTVARDYTRELIDKFALGADVTLAGAPQLAGFAEAAWLGQPVGRDVIAREIAPAFVEKDGKRTDVVALACTHYPLILDRLRDAAPWEVDWLDPSDAIARRLEAVAPQLNRDDETPGLFVSTEPPAMTPALERRLVDLNVDPEPIKLAVLPDRRGVA